jgi:hypothetical protein
MPKYNGKHMNTENTLKPTTIPQLVDFLGIKFNAIDQRFDNFHLQFLEFKQEMYSFKTEMSEFKKEARERFDNLEERIFPTSNDREDLEARVSYIEKKLKIKSGK